VLRFVPSIGALDNAHGGSQAGGGSGLGVEATIEVDRSLGVSPTNTPIGLRRGRAPLAYRVERRTNRNHEFGVVKLRPRRVATVRTVIDHIPSLAIDMHVVAD